MSRSPSRLIHTAEGKKGSINDDKTSERKDPKSFGNMTVCNPPRFFDKEMENWKKKFSNAVKQRETIKKLITRTDQISCRTQNINLKQSTADSGRVFAKSLGKNNTTKGNSRGSDRDQSNSLFQQVLKRRKSRQSNDAFCNIDFDYAGDSG